MISAIAYPETKPTPVQGDPPVRNRLLVVDDHPAVRAGLLALLDQEPDLKVVAAVSTAEEALRVAARQSIDVAVVDYQLGSRNGLWLSRKLKRLETPPAVLIYSAFADGILAATAVVAEADGLISKGSLGSELCEEVRLVAGGGRSRLAPLPAWLSETVQRLYADEEKAIFGMLLAGIGKDEIAWQFGLSTSTLDSHLGAMLGKLEAHQNGRRFGM